MKIWEEWRLASVSRLGERTSYLRKNVIFFSKEKVLFESSSEGVTAPWLAAVVWKGISRQSNLSRHLSQGYSAGVAWVRWSGGVRED